MAKKRQRFQEWLRIRCLSAELANHLRRKKYDLVWTQWYSPDVFDHGFWNLCRRLGIPLVHTVHNVLPHEPHSTDRNTYRKLYESARLLIVHSRYTQQELAHEFPHSASKTVVMPHGTYASLHQRRPESRARLRRLLQIDGATPALLFCGAIRPYKNIDAVIEAMADPALSKITLIVAGEESHYPNSNSRDPLTRTRALAARWGVESRVRLLPRMLHTSEMSELLEASDLLLLPYLKSYGSGLLSLGMTFGKHIVATRAGGSAEYLGHYPKHTLLEGSWARHIALGVTEAIAETRSVSAHAVPPGELSWRHITAPAMKEIEQRPAFRGGFSEAVSL